MDAIIYLKDGGFIKTENVSVTDMVQLNSDNCIAVIGDVIIKFSDVKYIKIGEENAKDKN